MGEWVGGAGCSQVASGVPSSPAGATHQQAVVSGRAHVSSPVYARCSWLGTAEQVGQVSCRLGAGGEQLGARSGSWGAGEAGGM